MAQESDGAPADYIRQRDAHRRLWATRATRHGGALAATASTAWVRAGTLRRLRRLLRHGDRVLEVGCGNGNLLRALPAGCTAVGADLTMEMLLLARTDPHHLRDVVRADATWLPFQARELRSGLIRLAHQRAGRGMQNAAIRELLRVVKPDGTVVLVRTSRSQSDD
jgi:ubiquinone/menaquinone biosynthesis C-methylase UbiE